METASLENMALFRNSTLLRFTLLHTDLSLPAFNTLLPSSIYTQCRIYHKDTPPPPFLFSFLNAWNCFHRDDVYDCSVSFFFFVISHRAEEQTFVSFKDKHVLLHFLYEI